MKPHDSEWAARFREVSARIRAATGLSEDRVHHVGSTAVPGLLAKPIIDIDLVLVDSDDVADVVAELVQEGFIDRGDGEGGIGRLVVWESEPRVRTVHIHITPYDSPWWRDDLAFRDALRRDPSLRRRYAAAKIHAARRFPADRKSYREAKNAASSLGERAALPASPRFPSG